MKEVLKEVKRIILLDPSCAEDDFKLCVTYWKRQGVDVTIPALELFSNHLKYGITPPISIVRARQKVLQPNPELSTIQGKRRAKVDEYREMARL